MCKRVCWDYADKCAFATKISLKRVGPRGSGEFEEITWEEALNLATTWLKPIREKNPEKLAFLLVGINLNPLHLFGHKTLARLIMQRMVVLLG